LENKHKIRLTPEQETLLVPLYCKALKENPVLFDHKAQDILQQIDYDFTQLHVPRKTCLIMSLRAQQFDTYTQKFLTNHPVGVVIHLGCGLDNRYNRINNRKVDCYDLDMHQVVELRKDFFQGAAKYYMISSSVIEMT
jgi:O-methyltransferase involved in polyketide biosynthesis